MLNKANKRRVFYLVLRAVNNRMRMFSLSLSASTFKLVFKLYYIICAFMCALHLSRFSTLLQAYNIKAMQSINSRMEDCT